jgi:hypothetical protein
MRVLQLCKDLFDKTPDGDSVKELFQEMREWDHAPWQKGATYMDKRFFGLCSQYLGGRSYNKFLDYSLLAIKLNHIYNKYWTPGVDNKWESMRSAILNLLADDRHDMYQNIPYELEEVAETLGDKQGEFWSDVVDAMIECINVEGTGDIAHTFEIEE